MSIPLLPGHEESHSIIIQIPEAMERDLSTLYLSKI